MLEKLKTYTIVGLVIAIVGVVAYGYIRDRSSQSEITRLHNEAAVADTTHKELQNSFTRLSEERDGLKTRVDGMQKLLDQNHQVLVAEQQISLGLKQTLEYTLKHQPKPPDPKDPGGGFIPPAHQEACTAAPQAYTASQDIGFLKFRVDTFTVDPSYQQKLFVDPGDKPLQLTLDLTRDKNKQWHYHVTPSDPRVSVNIDRAVVNLEPLSGRWYERIWLDSAAGLSNKSGIVDLGVSYEFGRYKLGPKMWQQLPGERWYGLSLSYAPFKSN